MACANDQWRVVDFDSPDTGIPAELYLKKGSLGNGILVAKSDSNGYASPSFECPELETLTVLPKENSGYFRNVVDCLDANNPITLQNTDKLANLLINSKVNINRGKFGNAALALREASVRLTAIGITPDIATALSNSSTLSAAKAVNATGVITVGSRGAKLSESVTYSIAAFQKSANINAKEKIGQPTYATVRKLSDVTPWDLVSRASNQDASFTAIFKSVNDEKSLRVAVEKLYESDNPNVFAIDKFREFGLQ